MNVQCLITLQSHSLLSLVGSSVDSVASSFLGGVCCFTGLLCSCVGSILGSTLDGVTGSTYG